MKRFLCFLALLAAVLLSAAPVPAEDNFYVIATGPIPVGTKISYLPYTITAPGYYYLGGNLTLTTSGGTGITINTGVNDVTIDLAGFTLTGPADGSYCYGIYWYGNTNVEVRNGTVRGWYAGVVEDSPSGAKDRVIGVRAEGNGYGIALGGDNHLIKGCTASQGSAYSSTGYGLFILGNNGCISGSTVRNYTTYGIVLDGSGTITGNLVMNGTGSGAMGIYASGPATISHNVALNCTTGLSGAGGGSVIGNAVLANSGQNGIVYDVGNNMFDQNTAAGSGTRWLNGGSGSFVGSFNGG
jgi:hypothetical protein